MHASGQIDDVPAIHVDGLSKSFGGGEDAVQAVDDISFEIEAGSVVGLLGPNGAGKTTAIKSMLGLVIPDAGTVEIAGIDVYANPNEVYENIGVILEGARNIYWRLTVRENLEYFAGLGGDDPSDLRERHDELLAAFDLEDHADTPVKNLSRGMKQKVSLATTLARDVDVVFLDEPTLGLDIEAAIELRAQLRQLADDEAVTIVICSHDMDVIETVCDDVLIMYDGRIVAFNTVEGLLELFQSSRYEITLTDASSALRRRLESVDGLAVEAMDSQLTVTIHGAEKYRLYDALDVIRSSDSELRTIRTLEPELEEVFLEVIESGSDSPAESASRATTVGTHDAQLQDDGV